MLQFTQVNPPKSGEEEVVAAMDVTLSGVRQATKAEYTVDLSGVTLAANDVLTINGETITLETGTLKTDLDGKEVGGYTLTEGQEEKKTGAEF